MGWVLLLALPGMAVGPWPARQPPASGDAYSSLLPTQNNGYPAVETPQPAGVAPSAGVQPVYTTDLEPTSASWIVPADGGYPGNYVEADTYGPGGAPYRQPAGPQFPSPATDPWHWQMLPEGIIYRSYWAGLHEPRTSVVLFDTQGTPYWDAALGGRVGLLRFGNDDPFRPQGWQLDFEGAALPRLTLDDMRDLDSVDFRAGAPLTYGVGDWQFKLGYYHLSSHLGDEFAIRNDALDQRINYVRDALVLGASYYPVPMVRLYSEVAYAMNAQGGAEPWEIQFGTEISRPGPTGFDGTPFAAVNAHLREEHDFGGDLTAQVGWLWRNEFGRTLRFGGHYFNGKSSQYQFFDAFEQQVGVGIWYDF